MSRRVATITLNPAYDLVGFTPEIERGEVNLVRTTGLHAAGKGICHGLHKCFDLLCQKVVEHAGGKERRAV